ncbi:hypothetical protein AB835_00625 [Candidatus Endobugula sertula]|uniref:Uncharacterized protein n=1 Tax=Candidatus Endobugula sertula TaxID=62101 RepID=A0A1D2QU20_9GAMM|nr:hypothetical protein AB835_00625 [Candidatus Endobugula sertula]
MAEKTTRLSTLRGDSLVNPGLSNGDGNNGGSGSGSAIMSKASPLKRLNYFDGKFLRAPDLITEQQALLNQIRISNQAGGYGIVHGYDCTLVGNDTLTLSGGLAIDAEGRVLLLNDSIDIDIAELIETSRHTGAENNTSSNKTDSKALISAEFDDCILRVNNEAVSSTSSDSTDMYLISLHHIEAYCGEEDVYGKLCSEACSTSTNRSYIIEGIEVRATPLNLSTLLKQSSAVPLSEQHLRSRIAAAYYEEERLTLTSHISAQGLSSSIWCLGAEAQTRTGVPIAVLGRSGNTTAFLDAWIARRERMEAPPRHYWAGRLRLRSWNIFLAQILQFQCQLRHCLSHAREPDSPCVRVTDLDPCADTHKVAAKAAEGMRYLLDQMSRVAEQLSEYHQGPFIKEPSEKALNLSDDFSQLELDYQKLIDVSRVVVPDRLLINCGIVEVPSAGYLPVNVSSTVSVNEQVERQFGPGVNLRFCVVRPDYVAHALEEVQHMDRICLLSGIDNPEKIEEVDVLVPNGEIIQQQAEQQGTAYQAQVSISSRIFILGWPEKKRQESVSIQDAELESFVNDSERTIDHHSSSMARSVKTNRHHDSLYSSQKRKNPTIDLPELSGAARGEQLESGGYSFYCAAQSGSTHRLQQAETLLPIANQSPQSILQLLDGEKNVTKHAAKATTDHQKRMTHGLSINTNVDAIAGFATAHSSFWVDLKVERDPFTLTSGEVTDIRAKITMVITRSRGGQASVIIEERNVTGQLHIQNSAPQKADTKLTARLIGDGLWKEVQTQENPIDDDINKTRTEQVHFDEQVVIAKSSVAGLPPSVQVSIINPSFFAGLGNVQLIAERHWVSATQSRMRIILRYSDKKNYSHQTALDDTALLLKNVISIKANEDIILAETVLTETIGDNSVLLPGNPFHSASLTSLDHIAQVTQHSAFADQAGQLLFPPLVPTSSELRILAKASWILFHRRREKTCHQKIEEDAIVKPRLYRVYHIDLPPETVIDEVTAALADDISAVVSAFQIRPVTTIEYAPALANITTNHGDIRADWQSRVQVSADVHIGVIASQGDVLNEGETLSDARLQSLTNVLSTVSETADHLALLNVNNVPPTLSASEVDGVIIYFTKAVTTICHSVFGITTNDTNTFIQKLEEYLEVGGMSLATAIPRLGGQALSVHANFVQGSDQFFGAHQAQQLIASWRLLGHPPIRSVLALSANETNEAQLMTRSQSLKISQLLRHNSGDNYSHRESPANIFNDCSKATLLITETECHDIYFFYPFAEDEQSLIKKLTALVKNDGITAEMIHADPGQNTFFRPLTMVDFYRESSEFESDSQQQLLLHWHNELNGVPSAQLKGLLMTIARPGANEEETNNNVNVAKAQGEKIEATLGITSSIVLAETNNPQVTFPVDCRALTLVVLPRQSVLDNERHVAVVADIAENPQPPEGDNSSTDDTPNDNTTNEGEDEKLLLSVDFAEAVSFDHNNEVIRDARFIKEVERLSEIGTVIKQVEVIGMDHTSDAAAKLRAENLLHALKQQGLAKDKANVVAREADAAEKLEIVKSGFALEHSIVLS